MLSVLILLAAATVNSTDFPLQDAAPLRELGAESLVNSATLDASGTRGSSSGFDQTLTGDRSST